MEELLANRKLLVEKRIPVGPYQDDNLCAACQGLNMDDLSSPKGYLHQSVIEMVRPSMRGCKICRLLELQWRLYREENPAEQEIMSSERELMPVITHDDMEWKPITMKYLPNAYGIELRIEGTVLNVLDVSEHNGNFTLESHVIPLHPLPFIPASEYCAELIDTWMKLPGDESILNNSVHNPCSLPKRVIDIGSSPICLRDFSQIPLGHPSRQGLYVALSHRWNSRDKMLLTEKKTVPMRLAGIDTNELSLGFRDAIEVTRLLGLKYIWIDCLCIIQDSASDWEEEASKMHIYYSSSWLTMAIGQDSELGCFSDRQVQLINGYIEISHKVNGFSLISKQQDPNCLEKSILHSRGWTYQEEMLSPRYICFLRNEMVFRTGRHWFHRESSRGNELDHLSNDKHRTDGWIKTIEDYTLRELTFDLDKLPAVSGMAHRYRNRWHDDYLAGLWRKHLVAYLCWFRSEERRPITSSVVSSKAYRAPSWSWASINYGVTFCVLRSKSEVEIIEASTELSDAGLDPMGQVKDATLTVRAALTMGTYSGNTGAAGIGKSHHPGDWVRFSVDSKGKSHDRNADGRWTRLLYADHDDFAVGLSFDTELPCLVLTRFSALVLKAVQPSHPRWTCSKITYQRIGYVELHGDDAGWISDLKNQPQHIIHIV